MALEETPAALARASEQRTTAYEAAFAYNDVVARTDGFSRYEDGWHMTEVKAATSGKDHFFQDCAVQARVAGGAGYPVRKVTLAHIDKRFVYQGGEDFTGLLLLVDATSHVAHLKVSVIGIVERLRIMLAQPEPDIRTGDHCSNPYDCPFLAYCRGQEPPGAEYPVEVFGRLTASRLRRDGYFDARQVVDRQLTRKRDKPRPSGARRMSTMHANDASSRRHATRQPTLDMLRSSSWRSCRTLVICSTFKRYRRQCRNGRAHVRIRIFRSNGLATSKWNPVFSLTVRSWTCPVICRQKGGFENSSRRLAVKVRSLFIRGFSGDSSRTSLNGFRRFARSYWQLLHVCWTYYPSCGRAIIILR